ncbi:MAG: hypothetical protein MUD01_22575 [Chloroflexaceae bacterium]|nr:hypothetical protein [Chloroflexaceae bacterium]
MGTRNSTVTPPDANDDATFRRRLQTRGYLEFAEPPPGLAAKVLANMPQEAPALAAQRRQTRFRWPVAAFAGLLVLLLAFGTWGLLIDSAGPARMLGDLSSGLSRVVLLLTLAAKPLLHVLAMPGLPALLLLTTGGLVWLWWRLARVPAFADTAEAAL